jgi:hypothetical protein
MLIQYIRIKVLKLCTFSDWLRLDTPTFDSPGVNVGTHVGYAGWHLEVNEGQRPGIFHQMEHWGWYGWGGDWLGSLR